MLGQGGLYPSQCAGIVQDILSSRDGDMRRAILDLGKLFFTYYVFNLFSPVLQGCGSGIWTIEMAREFPDCDVVGLDLAPAPVDIDALPTNCRFEIDDINLGLSHYHNQFDVIHVRCIGSGVRSLFSSDSLTSCRASLASINIFRL